MKKQFNRVLAAVALAPLSLFVAVSAHATGTPIDVSAAVDTIAAQATPISDIALAMFTLVVIVKLWKMFRRAT
jgi:uncharacterized membrane protein